MPTFREAAHACHEMTRPGWRNEKHAANWLATLERHAMPKLGQLPVDRITRADVLAVLTPIWGTRQETARRVRQRIRAVMRWAVAHGHRGDNPAGEGIDGALPPMPAIRAHFRALPHREVPAALEIIAASTAGVATKTCFEFLVLTAARSGEGRGATWDEIDPDARLWTIPAERMKGGVEHRVPLTEAAIAALARIHRRDGIRSVEWEMRGMGMRWSGHDLGRWAGCLPSVAAGRPYDPLWTLCRARWRGEHAARDTRGPGWRESVGTFGCPVGR